MQRARVAAATSEPSRHLDAPGPGSAAALRLLPRLRRDPLGVTADLARTHGDIVGVRVGPLRSFVVFHPDHLAHVLETNHRNYRKGAFVHRTKVLVGEGLFSSDGEPWRRQRRLAQPAFHRARIAALCDTMRAAIDEALREWDAPARRREPLDLSAEMGRLALRVLGRTLLGIETGTPVAGLEGAMLEALGFVGARAMTLLPTPLWIPTGPNRRFLRARRTLDAFVYDLIARRRASGRTGDLLSTLLDAYDGQDGDASDRLLRDEVLTLVLAGHETTALALTWSCFLVASHPDVEARLRAEVVRVLGSRAPGLDDLPALPFSRMVLAEAMRLYPPLWAFPRQAIGADALGPYRVPARAALALVPYLTHRLASQWDDPERFDPERFDAGRARERHPYAYLPFGGGPRGCIGEQFALLEARLALAMTVQRYRVRLVPGRTVVAEARTTLRPRGGLWVTLEPA